MLRAGEGSIEKSVNKKNSEVKEQTLRMNQQWAMEQRMGPWPTERRWK